MARAVVVAAPVRFGRVTLAGSVTSIRRPESLAAGTESRRSAAASDNR